MVPVLVLVGLGVGAGALGAADAGGRAEGEPTARGGGVHRASPTPREPVPSARPAGPVASARPPGAPPPGQPAAGAGANLVETIEATDWWSVLQALDGRRAHVLQAADAGALDTYAAAASRAFVADAALVAALVDSGVRPVGLDARLVAIERAGACPDAASACLEVVDRRSDYRLVDPAGEVVQEVPRAAPSRWRITLVPHGAADASDPGWRLTDVVPVQ